MGLGWFDAIAPAVTQIGTGLNIGRAQAAELQQKLQQAAMERALTQAQIDHYAHLDAAPEEWHPSTLEEAKDYELSIHPERTEKPGGSTPTSEWAKAGFADTPEGRQEYLHWLGQKSRTEYPERFRAPATPQNRVAEDEAGSGDAILSAMGGRHDAVAGPFSQAYAHVLAQHPDWAGTPGRAATVAMHGLQNARPDLFRAPPKKSGDILEELGITAPVEDADSVDTAPDSTLTPGPADTATPAEITAPTQRRVITQDQADYLRATNQWDPTRYEVR